MGVLDLDQLAGVPPEVIFDDITGEEYPINLPQGEGFRFVDRIRDLTVIPEDEEMSVTTEWHYTGTELLHLDAHFPNNPILPGVILQEVMNQCLIQLAQAIPAIQGCNYLLREIHTKFSRMVEPPATIVIEGRICDLRDNRLGTAKCRALVNGQRVAESTITFFVLRAN